MPLQLNVKNRKIDVSQKRQSGKINFKTTTVSMNLMSLSPYSDWWAQLQPQPTSFIKLYFNGSVYFEALI